MQHSAISVDSLMKLELSVFDQTLAPKTMFGFKRSRQFGSSASSFQNLKEKAIRIATRDSSAAISP
jgi:hypothetical protein